MADLISSFQILSTIVLALWIVTLVKTFFYVDMTGVWGISLVVISLGSCSYCGIKTGETANKYAIPLFSGVICYSFLITIE